MEILLVGAVAIICFVLGALLVSPIVNARNEARFEVQRRQDEDRIRQEAVRQSSSVRRGYVSERFAPLLEGFGYDPADARFLGSPVDYIVFDGMADGEIRGVALVEVKSGRAWLTPFQRQLQQLLTGCCVKWRVVQLDD